MDTQGERMTKIFCNFCGSDKYEKRKTDYLYSHQGKYLLIPDMPVEICLECGMIYYEAAALKKVEKQFFSIQQKIEIPDSYVEIPIKSLSSLQI